MEESKQVHKYTGKHRVNRLSVYLFTLILVYLLTSCVSLPDPETSQDFTADIVATIVPGKSVGQTLVSRRARLDGISLWLKPVYESTPLKLELFHTPVDTNPIFTTTIAAKDGETRIEIPPQPDPPKQHYFIRLSVTQGEIQFLGRDEEIYPYGNAFLNQEALDADLAFRATYDYDWRAAILDLRRIASQIWLVFPLGILLLIPGWLLIDFSNLRRKFDFGERIAISLGISIAIVPVLMLWTGTLGISWSKISVRFVAGVLLAALVWRKFATSKRHITGQTKKERWEKHSIILVAIFMLSLFVRVAMVRDLAMPAWVDSVHHSLITQAIVKAGGIPTNYLPHIPVEASLYHPGYHAILATFHWLTGQYIPNAMLILGQVLNALMVFSAYFLTISLVKDRNAGLFAALVTGLFTLMPAYYASWGRYTQLAGLLILPVVFTFGKKLALTQKAWRLCLGGITLAGLFLVHYRVLIFTLLLIFASWIAQLYGQSRSSKKGLLRSIQWMAMISVLGVMISLPWVVPTLTEYIYPQIIKFGGGGTGFHNVGWRYLSPGSGIPAMILAGLGLVWGIFRRHRFAITILIWTILLYGVAKPNMFGVPFLPSFINQTSVEIMLFLPISILGGFFVSQGIAGIEIITPTSRRLLLRGVILSLGVGLSILGAQRLLPTLNPVTFLFREDDKIAMTWIRDNIPVDEVVVINPTPWGYGLYMGNDGGFWISPLTDRQTIPPNVQYGVNRESRSRVNQFVEELVLIGEDSTKIRELLQKYKLQYIYIGARGGIISAKTLNESQLFETIFHYKSTWMFRAID